LSKTSKTGILGLVRSLAASLPTTHGIRVNGVCPAVTATPLGKLHVVPVFESLQLPINSSLDVANPMAGLCCDGNTNGKILYVEAGVSWDIEEGLARTRPQWLGSSVVETLDKIAQYHEQGKI
jgi:NAD(P)-dependent dehydrogenase (short-subunit alcohol dehydrogenase family)